MKLLTFRTIQYLLLALLLGAICGTAWSQVYKVVDKDGNVTYTDTAPKDGSAPVNLAPISVIETPEYQVPVKKEQAADDQAPTLRELRGLYKDFAITSPQQEDSEWAPDQNLTIQWQTSQPLLEGMLVRASIDGSALTPTTSNVISAPPLDRGEHKVAATLVDAKGKVIANAVTVTFFVRQPNLYSNPRRPRPRN
jgi:hypothetical protein